jgi:hypothetical protein
VLLIQHDTDVAAFNQWSQVLCSCVIEAVSMFDSVQCKSVWSDESQSHYLRTLTYTELLHHEQLVSAMPLKWGIISRDWCDKGIKEDLEWKEAFFFLAHVRGHNSDTRVKGECVLSYTTFW